MTSLVPYQPQLPAEVEEELPEPKETTFYTVAVFLVDRAWGGHEEGGWWFDTGEPQDDFVPYVTTKLEEALAHQKKMQEELDATVNVGRRPISSVLSEGMYHAEVCDGFPKAYPEVRPHYE